MRLLLVQALWATAASSRGWSEVRVLENVGVVVRPRAKPSSGRGPMLRRLRREGVNRVRLLSYGAREIGDAVGLASLSSVTHQLGQLELSGYLRRDPNRPRALEVLIDLPGSEEAETAIPVGDAAMVPNVGGMLEYVGPWGSI